MSAPTLLCPACGAAVEIGPDHLRVAFTFHGLGDFVLVVDLDRGMSVTNDAEHVVEYLAERIPLAGKRVIYRDTDGTWDELRVRGGEFLTFGSIGTKGDCLAAIAKAVEGNHKPATNSATNPEGTRPFLLHLADMKAPRLSRHWACPECGPQSYTDEDGCCLSCGRDCNPDAPPDVEDRKP